MRERRAANPEAERAKDRRWYAAHADRIKARKREEMRLFRATPEGRAIHAARERKRRAKNGEHVRALEHGYYQKYGRDKAHRRRGWLIEAPRRVTDRDWRRLVQRYGGRCAYCGKAAQLHQDHVIPLARGGRHSIGNLLPACQPCNSSKGRRLVIEWRYQRRAAA